MSALLPKLPGADLRALLVRSGFALVVVAVFLLFSFTTRNFATAGNVLAMLHAMAPLVVFSCAMALVVLSGKMDMSIGSVAMVSCTVAVWLMKGHGVHPAWAFLATLLCGMLLGAFNGFVVAVLGVNALIATLGAMIALRGVSLQYTKAVLIPVPESGRVLGNASLGPVFYDIVVLLVAVTAVHLLHRRTVFGRHLNAIGNGEDVAQRIGIPVRRTVFLGFVASGLLASFAGILSLLQVGAISGYLGRGMEFTAVAVVVVGGISLFGGRGAVMPGVLVGAFTFQIIQNGLNQLGANPYVYNVVTGAIIFVAMYADALKSGRIRVSRRRVVQPQSSTEG
jgi:ribose/xylose/arabinose/galactoside ABC-type transport system permease subunit